MISRWWLSLFILGKNIYKFFGILPAANQINKQVTLPELNMVQTPLPIGEQVDIYKIYE